MSLASAFQAAVKRFSPALAGRFALAALLALTTAGCFQPMYGEHGVGSGPGLRDKLAGVEVPPINAPNGSPVARIGVEVRNNLSFKLTGTGGSAVAPTHRLVIRMTTSRANIVVDINTSRPDVENYGIDATYELRDIAADKVIVTGQTFARVSYDIPGQQQRFARSRGLRDAENRAAEVIADNIGQRLAAYFSVGS
jgi:LPS-assembly lipoprotein